MPVLSLPSDLWRKRKIEADKKTEERRAQEWKKIRD